jgi:hypothetical protein
LIFCLHTHGSTCIAGATAGECVYPAFRFSSFRTEIAKARRARR